MIRKSFSNKILFQLNHKVQQTAHQRKQGGINPAFGFDPEPVKVRSDSQMFFQ